MINEGRRAGAIVERIRALSKKTELKKTELMNEVIEEVVRLVQREVAKHHASLQLELSHELPPVLADRVQLQQVIINLILNGIQAMDGVTDRPRELVIRSGQPKPDSMFVAVCERLWTWRDLQVRSAINAAGARRRDIQ
jgi:C4-dicarboxylate-specific signal transduction histidine kinase